MTGNKNTDVCSLKSRACANDSICFQLLMKMDYGFEVLEKNMATELNKAN